VVHVHASGEPSLLEDVRTGERVRVPDLAELGDRIRIWLGVEDGEGNPGGGASAANVTQEEVPR
jgi:hypothetical protein